MEVSLRQLTRQELEALSAGGRLAELAHVHSGAIPPPFVLMRAIAKLQAGELELWWAPFLIVGTADGAVVGGCAFKGPPKGGTVEVLYGVARSCRGRGCASGAVRQLAALGFANGAAEVLAEIEPGNVSSWRVVQKCGFRRGSMRTAEDGVSVHQWMLAK